MEEKTSIEIQDIKPTLGRRLNLERIILGMIMLEEGAYTDAAEIVNAEYFSEGTNRDMFRAMTSLHAEDKPIDMLTVASKMKDEYNKDVAFYVANLTSLVTSAATLLRACTELVEIYYTEKIVSMKTDNDMLELKLKDAIDEISELKKHIQDKESDDIDPSEIEESFSPACPNCGNTMVWNSDFMMSEIGYYLDQDDPNYNDDEDHVVHNFSCSEEDCEDIAEYEDLGDGRMVLLSHTHGSITEFSKYAQKKFKMEARIDASDITDEDEVMLGHASHE